MIIPEVRKFDLGFECIGEVRSSPMHPLSKYERTSERVPSMEPAYMRSMYLARARHLLLVCTHSSSSPRAAFQCTCVIPDKDLEPVPAPHLISLSMLYDNTHIISHLPDVQHAEPMLFKGSPHLDLASFEVKGKRRDK